MRPSQALAQASQTFYDSQHLSDELRPHGVWSYQCICAARRGGIAMANNHCWRIVESHDWLCACKASVPTQVLSHV